MSFRGIYNVSIDAKGRLAMPSKLRDQLCLENGSISSLIVTVDPDNRSILLYPLHVWEPIEARLADMSSTNRQAQELKQYLLGYSSDLEMDANGRILLPAMHRELAQTEKKVVVTGMVKRIEIWSEDAWKERVSAPREILPEDRLDPSTKISY